MRIIKLSPTDEDMRTRIDVLRYFHEKLHHPDRRGAFGLTEAKSTMHGIQKGTLLLIAYQTECLFLARADSGIILSGGHVDHPHFLIRLDTIQPVKGSLRAYERALRRAHLWPKQIVHTQGWPSLPDELEDFTIEFFRQTTPDLRDLRPSPVTVEDVIAYARKHTSIRIATAGHRTFFHAKPAGSGVMVLPAGSSPRRIPRNAMERYLWIFNRIGSFKTTDYRDRFRHASYILGLVREIQAKRQSKPESQQLTSKGQALLDVIVTAIRSGRIKKNHPETFLPYSTALSALGKSPWPRPGSRLRYEGLDDLNEWTKAAGVPLITGLIVSKSTWRPSTGFPASHGRSPQSDWEPWWLAQTRRVIDFDWSPYSASGGAIAVDVPTGRIPKRETTEISRIVRNTAIIREIKSLYNGTCQCCGETLELPSGKRYVEGHHLKPLGKPHSGPDQKSNVICVCPNCHVLLDFAAIKIDLGRLEILKHDIGQEFVDYHNARLRHDSVAQV